MLTLLNGEWTCPGAVLLLQAMPTPIRTLEARHIVPRCVRCGLVIRTAELDACPRCAIDFEERPPRSYADMEGLREGVEPPVVMRRPAWHERRIVERWLVVGFLAAIAIVMTRGLILASMRG